MRTKAKNSTKVVTNDLGKFLQRAREQKGLTQAEVAQRFSFTSPQPVSDWERNKGSGVPAHVFRELVGMLGVPFDKAYGLLVEFHIQKLEAKLHKKFYESGKKASKKR